MLDELPMMALVDARAMLRGHVMRLRMLVPPYPALGRGTLRALRFSESGEWIEIVAGYEAYERLD